MTPRLADDDDDDDDGEALLPDVDAPDPSPLCPSDLADRPELMLMLDEDILTFTRTLYTEERKSLGQSMSTSRRMRKV